MLHHRYYNLDAYHRRQVMKSMKMGLKQEPAERTEFNDEEQRRYEFWTLNIMAQNIHI